jgi:hypothetical protein
MVRPPNCIDNLTAHDAEALYQLRSESYVREFGSEVDPSVLRWNPWDDRFVNLGLFEQSQLVSVLRIAQINEERLFQKMMLCRHQDFNLTWPITVLSRAATRKGLESRGLHSLLRFYAFQLAEAAESQWIVSSLKANSKRISQLKRVGYELIPYQKTWDSFLKNEELGYLAKFEVKLRFRRGYEILNSTTAEVQKQFPPIFKFDQLVSKMKKNSCLEINSKESSASPQG